MARLSLDFQAAQRHSDDLVRAVALGVAGVSRADREAATEALLRAARTAAIPTQAIPTSSITKLAGDAPTRAAPSRSTWWK